MLVLLEHLNFKVPYEGGERLIKSFFVNQLGCPECPTGRMRVSPPVKGPIPEGDAKQMHVNLGLSQIHFEWCTGDGRPYTKPQKLEGSVTLMLRDMSLLRRNLIQQNTPFYDAPDGSIVLCDPFGITTWRCRPATWSEIESVGKYSNVRPGGVGNVLGMVRVDYDCQPGVSTRIVNFYNAVFRVPLVITPYNASIRTQFDQVIAFNETHQAPPPNGYDINPELWGLHMCFYIEDFLGLSQMLEKRFWVNPDYKIPPINDNVSTLIEALERKQFRMKHIGDTFVFEHEIRATDHPLSPLRTGARASL